MENSQIFKDVENVLSQFPLEYRKNYYINKNSLEISEEKELLENITGQYNNNENVIYLSNNDSLPHELFHMSFRDEEKIDKRYMKMKNYIAEMVYLLKKKMEKNIVMV